MAISQRVIEFNKEIIIGEIGATTGAPVFGYVASLFTSTPDIISMVAVLGAIIGGAIFFLSLRWYHKTKSGNVSKKGFVLDLAYFTPVAFILTLIISYPVLFFLSRYLQLLHSTLFSIVVSQATAFVSFLVAINVYRYLLLKYAGKAL